MYWRLLDVNENVAGEYDTFDEAMVVLAGKDGSWAANFSRWEVIKGTWSLRAIR